MKKIFTLILIAILSFNVKAQTSLTEAVDFTGTDCYGEEVINLFEILDRGQHVLIDFYFYSCTPCQRVVPYVVEAYELLGCNKHDVFFMEVTHNDNDELCQWWAEKYGVQYPTISRQGGGIEIQKSYGPRQYPTLVLISPDRRILLQDINYDSIKARETQYIVEQLEQFGIKQHNCDEEPIELASPTNLNVAPVDATSIVLTWDAVEYAEVYRIYRDGKLLTDVDTTQYIDVDLEENTEYCYKVVAAYGDIGSGYSEEVCATTLVDNISENEALFKVYPNPASSCINIKSNMTGEGVVVIYDMTGCCVKSMCVSDMSNATINLSDVEDGMYLIDVNGKKQKVVVLN